MPKWVSEVKSADFLCFNWPHFLGAIPSRKLLRIKVTPDLHLTYSKNGGNLGLVLKMKNIDCLSVLLTKHVRGVIDKFVSFFHRAIIYGWIYIIFCHYQQWFVVNRKKTLKCKVRQTCDVSMTLMTSHVGDVVVKTPEDRCGWFSLSGYKCYSTSAIFVKFADNICT